MKRTQPPPESSEFRQAWAADAAALYEAHQASVLTLCAGSYTEIQMQTWFEGRSPAIYGPFIDAGQIWLAETQDPIQGQIQGFVGYVPGEVTLLFVRPGAAGGGLGSRLFEFGLAKAAAGFDGPLTVVATQNSQGFYQRHGFTEVERGSFVRGAAQLPFEVVKMQRPQGR